MILPPAILVAVLLSVATARSSSPEHHPSPYSHGHHIPSTASSDSRTALHELSQLVSHAGSVAKQDLQTRSKHASCNSQNVRIRQEWGSMSPEARIDYTNAVRCLQHKSARTPFSFAPGAKTRFDDWVAAHIDQTLTIHYTGTFLAWHRFFLWEYERALQTECGYRGTQPYWNWGLTAMSGLENSALFDGSASSMGGNGEKLNQTGPIVIAFGAGDPIILPTGSGGGCVQSGPFSDMTVNLGPGALSIPGNQTLSNPNGSLSYNPRCLKRDLTDSINQAFANASATVRTILAHPTIYDFQMTMQGYPGSGDLGVHGGGHYTFGGDPGRDIFSSPGEPAFYLHHGMIDLVWSTWQALNPRARVYGDQAISGTGTFLNMPPSPNTTFETVLSLGYAGAGMNLTMRDAMSTIDGPFCYIYV